MCILWKPKAVIDVYTISTTVVTYVHRLLALKLESLPLALRVVWFHGEIPVITASFRFVCYFTVVNLGVFYH